MSPARKWFNWFAALFLIAVLWSLTLPTLKSDFGRVVTDEESARHDVRRIWRALKKYHWEIGETLPEDQPAIIRVLSGSNPKQTVFIHPRIVDEQGRALDPWGSPYRIDLSDPASPKVWSPGKNKKDEPED